MLHPVVTLDNVPSLYVSPVVSEAEFVAEVVRGMVTLWECGGRITDEHDLTVPLGLSAWIVRAGVGLPDACEALLELRQAIIGVAGLDRRTEPVPMTFGDPEATLRTLGDYLFNLVGRALGQHRVPAVELAEQVLSRLPARRVAS